MDDYVRNGNGQFTNGTKGGPGRKKRSDTEYLDVMYSVVTPTRWRKIIEKAAGDAERGNKEARKWLSDYMLGQPKQSVDVKTGVLEVAIIDDETIGLETAEDDAEAGGDK